MKTKKALLAEKLTLEQAIQALQTKAHSWTRTDHTDGSAWSARKSTSVRSLLDMMWD